jgi:hypothetical protein
MLIPVMETVVFIGRNLEPRDVGQVYFQDVESHREGVRYGWDREDGWAKFQTGSENEVSHILNTNSASVGDGNDRSHAAVLHKRIGGNLQWDGNSPGDFGFPISNPE